MATDGTTLFAAVGNRIYAIDRITGNQRWRFPTAEPLDSNFRTGTVLGDGIVVAAADNRTLYGIDATTGASKWTYNTTATVVGAPIMVGKYVVFAMSDNTLMAIYANDGTAAWIAPQRVFDGIQGFISSYLDNIIFVTQRQELVSVNVGSQNKNWGQKFAVLNGDVKPTIFGDQVYLSSSTFLVTVSAIDGRKRWQVDAQMPLLRNPSVNSTGVAVSTRDGRLMVFDLSGRRVLKQPFNVGSIAAVDPLIVGDFAAIGSQNGELSMINVKTGELVWNYLVPPLVKTTPAAAEGSAAAKPEFVQAAIAPLLISDSIYVVGRDGSILSFDRKNGVDLTPPEIKMLYPNPGEAVKGKPPFDVFFQIDDIASGLNTRTLKIEVDGTTCESTKTREGYTLVRFSLDGKNKPLQNGRRMFKVTASDWLGNTAVKEFALIIDASIPDSKPATNNPRTGPGPGRGGPSDGSRG